MRRLTILQALARKGLSGLFRHGPARVLAFAVRSLRALGPVGTVRYLLADPEERLELWHSRARPSDDRRGLRGGERGRAEAPAADDLDAAYTLTTAAWSSLLAQTSGADEARLEPPVHVLAAVTEGVADPAGAPTGAVLTCWRTGEEFRAALRCAPPEAWLLFCESGDRLQPGMESALAAAAEAADVVSFDLWSESGGRVQPLLAPGANPLHARHVDYLFSRFAMRACVAAALPGETPYALLQAWVAGRPVAEASALWRHVGQPLLCFSLAPEEVDRRRQLLIRRRPPAAAPDAAVSAVICTRDKGHLLRQTARAALAQPRLRKLVVVANETRNPYALETLAALEADPRVEVLHYAAPFNFSRQCNLGAAAAPEGELLFLNDDLAQVSDGWLDSLLACLDDPSVGAAGPLLLYPDERVQHAGMFLGYAEAAGHTLRGARLPEEDYLFMASAPRQVSALSGAALLVRREAWAAVNGFDELLPTIFQDVDLCLRLGGGGWQSVFEPAAVLLHMESASISATLHKMRVQQDRQAQLRRFRTRWPELGRLEAFHSPRFDPRSETLRRLVRRDPAALARL